MEKLISLMVACAILVSGAGSDPKKDYHWYIKHTNTHDKPVCESRFDYISQYDTFYVDPAANEENRVIYLTFDAGYENGNIEKILDIMKQESVTGAFFILDNMAYRNADLLKRMVDEGHLVCNHTAKHLDMTGVDEETFKAELKKMEDIYREKVGCELSPFYRPPEGKFTEENLKWAQDMGYKTVLWSFAYPDWDNNKQPDPQKSKEKILKNTHPGEILLLHPTSETNAQILGELIHEWKSMGYRFASLNELK